ncbi:MAG: DUF1844 domain-containing protein [Terracidiphilus sp.]
MSDTPKFEVIDRRKIKAEEEQSHQSDAPVPAAEPSAAAEPGAGPRLVVNEPRREAEPQPPAPSASEEPEMPPPPTADETREQKLAYDVSAQRLEDLVRAQNPAAGPQPPVNFDNLVQQLYVSAMIQMGAGTQEGQRPRVDILGARTTIDLIGVLAEKTRGNLTPAEERTLQTVLFEARMAFLELTSMISTQAMQPPVPPPGKK